MKKSEIETLESLTTTLIDLLKRYPKSKPDFSSYRSQILKKLLRHQTYPLHYLPPNYGINEPKTLGDSITLKVQPQHGDYFPKEVLGKVVQIIRVFNDSKTPLIGKFLLVTFQD